MSASSSAMDMDGAGHGHGAMLDCDGNPIPERQGNWQGHVFPASIFLLWALHWMISTSWRYLVASRAGGRPFRCLSAEPLLPMVPQLKAFNSKYPLESALKAVGGILLFFLQIMYGRYKTLVCPDGVRQGRLVTQHLNSWAHACMNLGFSASGVVELMGKGVVPESTEHVFLSMAFFLEAMLFSMHEKNGALDQTLHWLLAQCCWAGALFAALEAAFPSSVLLSFGRIASMFLQGTWFIESARVLFEDHPVWKDKFNNQEDPAPSMFLPLVFTFHMLVVSLAMFFVYMGLHAAANKWLPDSAQQREGATLAEGARLLDDEEKPDTGHGRGAVMLATVNGRRF